MTEDLIPIGRFARAARLSQKALRLYDENGLLRPRHVEDETGYRFYAWTQLRVARRIALLRGAGMPLAEIGRFIAEPSAEQLDAYRAGLETELAERSRILDFLQATIEEGPMYDVDVKHAPELRYVSRTREELSQDEVEGFVITSVRELMGEREFAGLPFTIYHGLAPEAGERGDEGRIDPVEVCVPAADGDRTLPAAEVAFTHAHGAQCRYPEIVGAYDAVWDWARANRRELAGPPREIYGFEPGEERVFEIAWPLR
jgi:DNA-binding transcriptional MerR regulator